MGKGSCNNDVKVLIISNFGDGTGYSSVAREYTLSLAEAGAEVCCRSLNYSGGYKPPPCDVEEYCKKTISPDIVLQITPPYFQTKFKEKSVGLFFTETNPLPTTWSHYASRLDLQISPTNSQKEWCQANTFWKVPTHVIPVPCDTSVFSKEYPKPKALQQLNGRFIFYTVGEVCRRKNLEGLLKAYFYAFKAHESVALVIKGSVAGQTPAATTRTILETVNSVQVGMKLGRVPPVLALGDRLSEEAMLGLHQHSDCFVQLSHAEGWGHPAFTAMGFGKTPIVSRYGGFLDYLAGSSGYLVGGRLEPVYGEGDVHAELFTGNRTWFSPDILEAAWAMRLFFEKDVSGVREQGKRDVSRFSRRLVGQQMMEVFRGHLAGTS